MNKTVYIRKILFAERIYSFIEVIYKLDIINMFGFKSIDDLKVLCSIYEIELRARYPDTNFTISNDLFGLNRRDTYIKIDMFIKNMKRIDKKSEQYRSYISYFNSHIANQYVIMLDRRNVFKLKILNKFERILFNVAILNKIKINYEYNIDWKNVPLYKITSKLTKQ